MKRCPFCGTNIPYNDNYCYSCQRTFEDPVPDGGDSPPPRLDLDRETWRKSWAAAGLSLVGVGLGQFYNGDTAKGLLLIAGFLAVLFILPLYSSIDLFLVLLAIWAVAIVDAWRSAEKINRLEKHFTRKSLLFWPETGVLLVIAGIIISMAVMPQMAARGMSITAGAVAETRYPAYAVPLYETAIGLSPNDTAIRLEKAKVMHTLGRDREALSELGYLMETQPNETAPLVMTGNLLYDDGEYEASIAYFEKALSLNRNDAQIWIRKGDADLAIAMVEMRKMREQYRTLSTYDPNPAGSANITPAEMDAFRSTQSYRDAMTAYNEAIRIDPLVSVEVSAHVLAATKSLLEMYQGILTDLGSPPNATSG